MPGLTTHCIDIQVVCLLNRQKKSLLICNAAVVVTGNNCKHINKKFIVLDTLTHIKSRSMNARNGSIYSITQISHCNYAGDRPLAPNIIPQSVTHLTFGCCFNAPLLAGSIPNSVKHLTSGRLFNQPLHTGCLPTSVKHLTFDHLFNQPVDGLSPPSVTHLIFGDGFDQPESSETIPDGVTHLTCGSLLERSLLAALFLLQSLIRHWILGGRRVLM